MSVKVLTAREKPAHLIPNGVNLATNGFIGASFPEEIAIAIEQRFLETGAPNDLTLLFCAAQGDSKDKGLNHFAHDGMVRRAIGGHGALPRNSARWLPTIRSSRMISLRVLPRICSVMRRLTSPVL